MSRLGVTSASLPSLGVAGMVQMGAIAADHGYDSYWVAEANGTEAFSMLAATGVSVPDVALGTGVLPVQARTPALAAMGAASLQALFPDRDIYLGVGLSAPGVAGRWHEAPGFDRPLSRMREYLTLLRLLLSGEKVDFDGDFHRIRGFRLGVRLGDRRPKIVVAALNDGMLRLGGELADAVLLNYLPSSHVAASVEQVRAGGDATVMAYVHAAVTDWESGAAAARKDLYGYAMAPGYNRMFRAAGYDDDMNALDSAKAAGDRDGMVAAISNKMIQDINFIGDAETVPEFVASYRTAGVDVPILMPMPWGADRAAVTEATIIAAATA